MSSVTATANGATAALYAKPGQSLIRVRKATAWAGESVALQFSHKNEGASFDPAQDADGAIVFTANGSRIVPTSLFYRGFVSAHAGADIEISVHDVTDV